MQGVVKGTGTLQKATLLCIRVQIKAGYHIFLDVVPMERKIDVLAGENEHTVHW